MSDKPSSDSLELLAYVDGHLDLNPRRKRAFENRLGASSKTAALVRAYLAQNEALRELHADKCEEPVPEHLYQILNREPARTGQRLTRIAALGFVATLTMSAGWFLGHLHAAPDWSPKASIERAYRTFLSGNPQGHAATSSPDVLQPQELTWLVDRISLTFRAPDLSKLGYGIVDTRTIENDGGQVARLTYEGERGARFSLFLRARWDDQDPEMQIERDGGVSVAYWLDGPLASAVVSELPPHETKTIAEAVRLEIRSQNTRPPAKTPNDQVSQQGGALSTATLPSNPGSSNAERNGYVAGPVPAMPGDM